MKTKKLLAALAASALTLSMVGVSAYAAGVGGDTEPAPLPVVDVPDEPTPPPVEEPIIAPPIQDNVNTGNPAVALAVIPVALAAAAVVARKLTK
jgi:hypothetical protein